MAKKIPGPERLMPLTDTVRELYLKSGNQCAFPDCRRLIMNSDGVYAGELCHIEAAKPDGPRFNSDMNDEDRRSLRNLVLMCHEHHKITDNVERFPVDVLQKYKADHEAKFTDVDARILDAIEDKSGAAEARPPATLEKFCGGPDTTPEMLEADCKEAIWVFEGLHRLPWRTRQLLRVIVSRIGKKPILHPKVKKRQYAHNVILAEIAEACDRDIDEVRTQVAIMEKYGIARLCEYQCGSDPPEICLSTTPAGWFIWGDFRDFCETENIQLRGIIEDLRFDLLD